MRTTSSAIKAKRKPPARIALYVERMLPWEGIVQVGHFMDIDDVPTVGRHCARGYAQSFYYDQFNLNRMISSNCSHNEKAESPT